MKLKFTYHAQSQILSRYVLESQVVDTIRRPDFVAKAAGDAMLYRKQVSSGILEVICVKKEQNNYLVLTAYFL